MEESSQFSTKPSPISWYSTNRTWVIHGIYQIRNLYTGKFYVGKSNDVFGRLRNHLFVLRSGKHHSKKLQHDFDDYGEVGFVCEIIDVVPVGMEGKEAEKWSSWVEVFYIKKLRPAYNTRYSYQKAYFSVFTTRRP